MGELALAGYSGEIRELAEGLLHGNGVRRLKLKSLADVQTKAARERGVVSVEDRSVVGSEVTTVMKRGKAG